MQFQLRSARAVRVAFELELSPAPVAPSSDNLRASLAESDDDPLDEFLRSRSSALVLFIRSCAVDDGCAMLLRSVSERVPCERSFPGCDGDEGCVDAGSAISGLLTAPLDPAARAGSDVVDWASA
ncbi:MAG: hypothetical protein Q8O08_07085 [Methyloversatilis sp.]|nr:hypothetical protein [Methyloversatilis sp.]